ncbi:TetR/AcrR family transcriptional regulator [Vagococcus fluvialis]|uniref:TetR/AcrR family transcriptional regulator n=1 Tax=Vagococcus fluvialis TaxID=2738 RepID=UPI001D0B5F43|nr:TetR/AcrR family transcriptional regulator [Vagococcus fluvialis]UDM74823.1 TetR/AcrR family transcriptional regulator [Vagococcus fluvialis]
MNKKEYIIDYATTLFMEQGYLATSTRQIAKGLGITQPAIYHHFQNKEDIYVQVLQKFTKKIGDNLYNFLNSSDSPEIILVNMSEFLIQNHSMNFSLMMKDVNEELPSEVSHKIFILWQENYFLPFYQFFDKLKHEMTEEINLDNVPLHFLRVLAAYTDNNINHNNQLPIKEMIHIFFFGIMKK